MTEDSTYFKQKIKGLRISMEKSAKVLRELEATGTEKDANRALWITSKICNSNEYSDIETALRKIYELTPYIEKEK